MNEENMDPYWVIVTLLLLTCIVRGIANSL